MPTRQTPEVVQRNVDDVDATERLARLRLSSADRRPYTFGVTPTLRFFGEIALRDAAPEASTLLVQSKVVALLARLAIPEVGPYVRRDVLVGLLWPELPQERARSALRKAVHVIRNSLGADALTGRGDEELALSAGLVRSDVADFTAAADSGLLMQALQLYRGEIMPGFHLAGCGEFDYWLEQERAVARERASAAAWALAQQYETNEQLTDAAGMARRAIRFSWTDERALRRALAMLHRLGDRSSAAKLYAEFERRLKAELDVTPSPETLQLIERIRSDAA